MWFLCMLIAALTRSVCWCSSFSDRAGAPVNGSRWGNMAAHHCALALISPALLFASKGGLGYLCLLFPPPLLSNSVTISVFCLEIDFCVWSQRLPGFISPSLYAVVKPVSSCHWWGLEGFWSCVSPFCHPLPRWHYANREGEGDWVRGEWWRP